MFNSKKKRIEKLESQRASYLEDKMKIIRHLHCIRLNLVDIKYSKSNKNLTDIKAIENMERTIKEIIKVIDNYEKI